MNSPRVSHCSLILTDRPTFLKVLKNILRVYSSAAHRIEVLDGTHLSLQYHQIGNCNFLCRWGTGSWARFVHAPTVPRCVRRRSPELASTAVAFERGTINCCIKWSRWICPAFMSSGQSCPWTRFASGLVVQWHCGHIRGRFMTLPWFRCFCHSWFFHWLALTSRHVLVHDLLALLLPSLARRSTLP